MAVSKNLKQEYGLILLSLGEKHNDVPHLPAQKFKWVKQIVMQRGQSHCYFINKRMNN